MFHVTDYVVLDAAHNLKQSFKIQQKMGTYSGFVGEEGRHLLLYLATKAGTTTPSASEHDVQYVY